jgi:hypothetical protein
MNMQLAIANWFILPLLLAGSPAMAQIEPVTPATQMYLKQMESVRVNAALAHLHATRNQLGLDSQTEFTPINTHTDHLGQTALCRLAWELHRKSVCNSNLYDIAT